MKLYDDIIENHETCGILALIDAMRNNGMNTTASLLRKEVS